MFDDLLKARKKPGQFYACVHFFDKVFRPFLAPRRDLCSTKQFN